MQLVKIADFLRVKNMHRNLWAVQRNESLFALSYLCTGVTCIVYLSLKQYPLISHLCSISPYVCVFPLNLRVFFFYATSRKKCNATDDKLYTCVNLCCDFQNDLHALNISREKMRLAKNICCNSSRKATCRLHDAVSKELGLIIYRFVHFKCEG